MERGEYFKCLLHALIRLSVYKKTPQTVEEILLIQRNFCSNLMKTFSFPSTRRYSQRLTSLRYYVIKCLTYIYLIVIDLLFFNRFAQEVSGFAAYTSKRYPKR